MCEENIVMNEYRNANALSYKRRFFYRFTYMYMYFYEDLIFPSYENNFRNILVPPYKNIINHQNVVYQKYPYTFHIIK